MKRSLQFGSLMILAAVMIAGGAPSAQGGQCSQKAAAGKYGFTLTGLLILPTGPIPVAGVGQATVDEAGNVSGTETRSVGGGVADETLTGTLTVNPDCTGGLTLKFFELGQLVRTSVLATVYDDNQRELCMIQKSLVLPNGASLPVVITVEARKMFCDEEQDEEED